MARDGAGTFNLPDGNPVVTETVISSTVHNTTVADLANGLTQSISKDGQTTYTNNQPMGGFRHTSVGDAQARNQYATAGQVQDGNLTLIGSVSGSNTITGSLSPAITTYPLGVFLTLIPFQANTGPVTLQLNGLAARPVVKFSGVPLVAGDLLAGIPATLVYNNGNFYLENPQVVSSDVARLNQPNNFTSNNTFSAVGTAVAPTVVNSSALPISALVNTSAPVNSKSWLNYVGTDGSWVLRADSDDHSNVYPTIVATRSAHTVTTLQLAATNITFNGVNVSDYPRKSQDNIFTGQNNTFGRDGSNGYVNVQFGGSQGYPGYLEFYTPNNVRRGYIGFGDGANHILISSDNGWSWNFVGAAPLINGTSVTDASMLQSGVLQNARVQLSNVTQHQTSLALTANQVRANIGGITSSISIDSSHAGGIFPVDNASTITLTVGLNALGSGGGLAALFIRRGAGAVTFAASGVTIRSPGGGMSITVLNGKVALIQLSADQYELAGNV